MDFYASYISQVLFLWQQLFSYHSLLKHLENEYLCLTFSSHSKALFFFFFCLLSRIYLLSLLFNSQLFAFTSFFSRSVTGFAMNALVILNFVQQGDYFLYFSHFISSYKNQNLGIVYKLRNIYTNLKMSYFYSQQITYCQCIMPRQIGWEVMNQLGQLELVHFQHKQLNYDNQYTKNLKRCDEAIGKVNDVKNFINEIKPKFKCLKVNSYKDLLKQFSKEINHQKIHGHLYINEIQDEIKNVHDYLSRQKKEQEKLEKDLHEKLTQLALFVTLSDSEDFKTISKQKVLLDRSNLFDYKCILINRKDQMFLQKGLFRISRGHCWIKTLNIDATKLKPSIHKAEIQFLEQKVACIIMFQFGQNNALLNKINRYLSCMECSTVTTPVNQWPSAIVDLQSQIKQMLNIQNLTNDAIERYLHKLYEPYSHSNFSLISYLQAYALKERQIYRRLASTTQSKNFLHFNIFIPTKSLPLKLNLPQKLPPLTLTPKQPPSYPPTKFTTNKILQIPQQILNTYGVPTYGQFNPAILYIVTFGFFIGVMFGDVGHMLMAIPFLLYFEVNQWAWIVVFFMGYCGIIYNEFFGLNLGFFDTCYQVPPFVHDTIQTKAVRISVDCVYPLGLDSIWKGAQNQMQYVNSYKMKLAVIFGICHMLLGLAIKIINNFRTKKWLTLLTVAIPQIIFMLCTFVYMDYLIIFKWNVDYGGENSKHAPSIIGIMISAFAGFGDVTELFWQTQKNFQKSLAIIAYLMIPIMLIGTPLGIYLKRRTKSKVSANIIMVEKQGDFNQLIDQKIEHQHEGNGSQDGLSDRTGAEKSQSKYFFEVEKIRGHESEQMSQIIVHSFIETIQYVLGTVSNTASYLRLWALSLAHGQLSEVIFSLILKNSVSGGYTKIIPAFFGFIFFYSVTFGVLICMDSMECFLHSLRLHWVEFQNKFYEGKGYKFEPYSFKIIEENSKRN